MADANPLSMTPQAPDAPVGGPEIVYYGDEARAVQFEINPNVKRYEVYSDGRVLETY